MPIVETSRHGRAHSLQPHFAVIQSRASFASITAGPRGVSPTWPTATSIQLFNQHRATYARIYRTQPQVRICVEFRARNAAQLGLHVFRRVDDTDRQRVTDHGYAQLLKRPNPKTTRYRFIEALMQDLGIYDNSFWVKVRTNPGLALLRLPPRQMEIEGGLFPTAYHWTPQGQPRQTFLPSDMLHLAGFDPENELGGLSPIETLRQVLAEEAAARAYSESFWKHGARINSVIERPKEAPDWSPEQRNTFRSEWQEMFTGEGKGGETAVLEDGMTLKQMSATAKDSELSTNYKLAREVVAAAYHIPQVLVGILDHATYSNVREMHKMLYQDCLGPPLQMLVEEFDRQLLVEFDDAEDLYCEFNIAAKMAGSFEEQAAHLQTAIGRPWMSVNEGRARLNLPKIDGEGYDRPSRPLNMSGGAGEDTAVDGRQEAQDA